MHFHRTYLSQQVADRLTAEIRNGIWQNHLPGERKLAAFFGVSRRTIRAALAVLARTGTFRSVEGRRILSVSQKILPVKKGDRSVILIVSATLNRLPHSFDAVSALDRYLALSGYTLHVEVMPMRVNSRRWLEIICNQRAAAWLLRAVAPEVQLWFEKRNLPALIIGSRHAGIRLPDLDVDYQAVCRHAAGTLLRLGHRRIVFLNSDSGFAGDLAGERGFNEAISAFTSGPVTARIVRHNDNVAKIGRILGRLFKGAETPSAIIVTRSCCAMTVLGYLARMGQRIPEDVSVIARDDDIYFENFVPALAHYRIDRNRFARWIVRRTIRLDQGLSLPSSTLRLIPQFVPGESLAPPRTIGTSKY